MKPPAYTGEEVQQQISPEQGERNVAMAVCVQLAGRAIIRVVSRCEEAQDNCNLGERGRAPAELTVDTLRVQHFHRGRPGARAASGPGACGRDLGCFGDCAGRGLSDCGV